MEYNPLSASQNPSDFPLGEMLLSAFRCPLHALRSTLFAFISLPELPLQAIIEK